MSSSLGDNGALSNKVTSLEGQLAAAKQELEEMKAKARLGDYAAGVFNFLKKNSPMDARLNGHANKVAAKIEAAEASSNPSKDP